MSEKLDNNTKIDIKLKQEIEREWAKVTWPVNFGTVSVKLRDGKPTLTRVELTIKHD